MQYFYYRRQQNMTPQEFAKQFPEAYKRLCEIMPRKREVEE